MKKITKDKKILFVTQDPGGFNFLFPVIKLLRKRNVSIQIFLANESKKIAERENIKYTDCTEFSMKELYLKLNNYLPGIIVTATSDGFSLEKKVINWAKNKKIFVISAVDFWSNYKIRFSKTKKEDLRFLPSLICVIDKCMRAQMVEKGFDKKIIKITGNPFFDDFEEIRKKGKYILFVSQHYSEINDKHFNEIEIFRDLVEILEKLNIKKEIIIGLHPREKNKNKFDEVISKSKLKIFISLKNSERLLRDACLVVGINTMVLFQASIIGKKVFSYQPGVKKNQDVLISNHLKLSFPAYNYEKLEKLLSNLEDLNIIKSQKIIDKYIKNNSTEKMINVIYKNL